MRRPVTVLDLGSSPPALSVCLLTRRTHHTSLPPSISLRIPPFITRSLVPDVPRPAVSNIYKPSPPSPSSGVFTPTLYSEPTLPFKKMPSTVNRATFPTPLDCLLSKLVTLFLCQHSTCRDVLNTKFAPRFLGPFKIVKGPRPYVFVVDFGAKFPNANTLVKVDFPRPFVQPSSTPLQYTEDDFPLLRRSQPAHRKTSGTRPSARSPECAFALLLMDDQASSITSGSQIWTRTMMYGSPRRSSTRSILTWLLPSSLHAMSNTQSNCRPQRALLIAKRGEDEQSGTRKLPVDNIPLCRTLCCQHR